MGALKPKVIELECAQTVGIFLRSLVSRSSVVLHIIPSVTGNNLVFMVPV